MRNLVGPRLIDEIFSSGSVGRQRDCAGFVIWSQSNDLRVIFDWNVMGEETSESNHQGVAADEEERGEEAPKAVTKEEAGDDEILQFLDSLDDYLLLMHSLSSSLRQGWLDLASARHSMGPSRISSTLFDHKEQFASSTVQVTDSTDEPLLETNPHFSLSKWGSCDRRRCPEEREKSVHLKLRYRGSATTAEGSQEDATSTGSTWADSTGDLVRRERSKSLSVFGALVSPKLRAAQVSFETALEIIVDLANSRSNILCSFSQIERNSNAQVDV